MNISARTSATYQTSLIISIAIAGVLLIGAAWGGAAIAYTGGFVGAVVGVLFAIIYLVASVHPWRAKVAGIVALLINGAVAAWLWAAVGKLTG